VRVRLHSCTDSCGLFFCTLCDPRSHLFFCICQYPGKAGFFVCVSLHGELDTIMSPAGVVQEVLLSFCSVSCCSLMFSMQADVKEGALSRQV
jgi:hypothetical protein